MRSRDGNITFSLSISTIIFLFSSLALNASEYLISYRYLVKDAILYNESLEISQSMQACDEKIIDSIIFQTPQNNNLYTVIKENNEEFIDFIHKLGLSVQHTEETANAINRATTILTLKTRCFKVDFNDTFVKISALK